MLGLRQLSQGRALIHIYMCGRQIRARTYAHISVFLKHVLNACFLGNEYGPPQNTCETQFVLDTVFPYRYIFKTVLKYKLQRSQLLSSSTFSPSRSSSGKPVFSTFSKWKHLTQYVKGLDLWWQRD